MTDYGKKIQNAINAVVRMHKDTSKLLQECDNTIGKQKNSVFKGYATDDLSRSYDAGMWIVEGVYRYYHTTNQPGIVDGVTVAFFDSATDAPMNGKPMAEPLFIVGQIEYQDQVWDRWDLWSGFFDWNGNKQELNKVIHPKELDKELMARIKNMKLIAVPLYQIKKIDKVEKLMKRVRASS